LIDPAASKYRAFYHNFAGLLLAWKCMGSAPTFRKKKLAPAIPL
jgi:hypothetical protein